MKKWYIKVYDTFVGDMIIDILPIKGTFEEVMSNMQNIVYVKSLGIHETFYFERFTLIDADTIDFPEHSI